MASRTDWTARERECMRGRGGGGEAGDTEWERARMLKFC